MPWLLILLALTAFVLLQRRLQLLADEIRGNLYNNRHDEPKNLARTSLVTLYWRGESQGPLPASFLPVTGVRINEPPRWVIDFRIARGAPAHYEVWWLTPQPVKRVRLLLDQSQTDKVVAQCYLSMYRDSGFVALANITSPHSEPFVADPYETQRRVPYAWLDIQMPEPIQTRSVRLTCNATQDIALHQWEAYRCAVRLARSAISQS